MTDPVSSAMLAMPPRLLSFVAALAAMPIALAAQQPALDPADRLRLAEAFRLSAAIGDSLWPGWNAVPFAVLLVTPEREFLVRHPRPSPDFARVGRDSLLDSDVFVRARTFAPELLATFPAVGGVPTVVVGQPPRTGKRSTEWIVTLLHEHFHQLQTSQPWYYERSRALGLARGDETGMWMLNYPFPYDSANVARQVAALADDLRAALGSAAHGRGAARARLAADRRALRDALRADDYRYLALQLWQEGVARYTELRLAELAARRYAPTSALKALPDYVPFAEVADSLRAGILAPGATDVARRRRVAFYPLGAALALTLDEMVPGWRSRYLEHPFDLDAIWETPGQPPSTP